MKAGAGAPRRSAKRVIAWSLLLLCLSPSRVLAQAVCGDADVPGSTLATPDEEAGRFLLRVARERYDLGIQSHDERELIWALEALSLAYALWPEPELLHNMGQAARHLGRCSEARHFYGRYLEAQANPERRALTERHLSVLGDCDAHAPEAPRAHPLSAAPAARVPSHTPSEVSAGVTLPVAAASEQSRPDVVPARLPKRAIVSGTLAGAALLSLIAAVVSAVQMRAAAADLAAARSYDAELEATRASGEAAQRRLWIFAPLAAGLGTSALFTWLFMDAD